MISSNQQLIYREPTSSEKYHISEFYGEYFRKKSNFFFTLTILMIFIPLGNIFLNAMLLSSENLSYVILKISVTFPAFLVCIPLFYFHNLYKRNDTYIKDGLYDVADVVFVDVVQKYTRRRHAYYLQYKTSEENESILNHSAEIPRNQFEKIEIFDDPSQNRYKSQVIKFQKGAQLWGVVYH